MALSDQEGADSGGELQDDAEVAPGLAGYLVVIVVWLFFAGAGRLRGTKIASFDSPLVKIATAWW